LFQRPKKKTTADSDVWYDNMVVGERYLGDMMKNISKTWNRQVYRSSTQTIRYGRQRIQF
jgi:hypothetical protein